jgi:hypothetical protein
MDESPSAEGGGTPTTPMTLARVRQVLTSHQPDRAWIEWGICRPPFSVARPRCVQCAQPWPCSPVLRADEICAGTQPADRTAPTAAAAANHGLARPVLRRLLATLPGRWE